MKSLCPAFLFLMASCAFQHPSTKSYTSVYVEGDQQNIRVIHEPALLESFLASGGGATDTPTSSSKSKVELLGHIQGHEILAITDPCDSESFQGDPFGSKLFVYRVGKDSSSLVLPFFETGGFQLRDCDGEFHRDENGSERFMVNVAWQGNGVYYDSYDFVFSEEGARLDEVTSGGRKMNTKVTHYRADGTVSSTEELDGN